MVVSQPISQTVRSFGLPRETSIDFYFHVHEDIPRTYEMSKKVRMADNRLFLHRYVSTDNSGMGHLFTFGIDDTTSADHLMIAQIQHRII